LRAEVALEARAASDPDGECGQTGPGALSRSSVDECIQLDLRDGRTMKGGSRKAQY
jgi:hypothetical protein